MSWINATNQQFKVFVENRVTDIRKLVNPEKWNYVPSSENSADILTRTTSFGFGDKWCEPSFIQPIAESSLIPHESYLMVHNSPIENEGFQAEKL